MARLTEEEINRLYEEFDTPDHVKGHCRGVTECALKIAAALRLCSKEYDQLDLSLIYSAGMVHDMARRFDAHEVVAADKLEAMGYQQEADIIREHMRCNIYHSIENVKESDLLYISDRMVLEDTFVGVEKRYEYIRAKIIRRGGDPDSPTAKRNRLNAENFVAEIERKTGRSIFDICE